MHKAAEEIENLSRRRRAEVDRLLDTVARTLTAKQQELFALSIREGLAGEVLGRRIGKTSAQASPEAYKLSALLDDGFGALVLAREGRPYCAELTAILDSAATGEDGVVFTAALRTRIVHHFGTCQTCDNCTTCAEQRRRLVAPLTPVLVPILVLALTRDRIEQSVERVSHSTPLPPAPPGPRPQRRNPAVLILPLLVVIAVVAGVLAATRSSDATVQPVSLAGIWQLNDPFNEPETSPGQQRSLWSFTGSCKTADDCRFTWLPLVSTTTFESEFTPDFRKNAKQGVPAGLPQNIVADLIVRPVTPAGFYTGKATAQYGIFDVQNQTGATGQETVILTIQVLDSTTEGRRQVATRLAISVDFAAHDFDPCSALCGRQSFEDLRQQVTNTATRMRRG